MPNDSSTTVTQILYPCNAKQNSQTISMYFGRTAYLQENHESNSPLQSMGWGCFSKCWISQDINPASESESRFCHAIIEPDFNQVRHGKSMMSELASGYLIILKSCTWQRQTRTWDRKLKKSLSLMQLANKLWYESRHDSPEYKMICLLV